MLSYILVDEMIEEMNSLPTHHFSVSYAKKNSALQTGMKSFKLEKGFADPYRMIHGLRVENVRDEIMHIDMTLVDKEKIDNIRAKRTTHGNTIRYTITFITARVIFQAYPVDAIAKDFNNLVTNLQNLETAIQKFPEEYTHVTVQKNPIQEDYPLISLDISPENLVLKMNQEIKTGSAYVRLTEKLWNNTIINMNQRNLGVLQTLFEFSDDTCYTGTLYVGDKQVHDGPLEIFKGSLHFTASPETVKTDLQQPLGALVRQAMETTIAYR